MERWDLAVVGGGPAGLAAARTAADLGLSVIVIEERPTLGGQIYKQPGAGFVIDDPAALGPDHLRGRALIDAVDDPRITVLTSTAALSAEDGDLIVTTADGPVRRLPYRAILVAAGAHDRPVVLPGWTLPGVITAGGAQTLVKTQRVLPGRRIAFAGSGPLALAFPAQLAGYGAEVVLALEAGPAPRAGDLLRIAAAFRGNTHILRDALTYRRGLRRHRVPLRYGRMVVRIEGDGHVERMVHAQVDHQWRPVPGTEEAIPVDTVCLGYGFVPSIELLRLLGCAFTVDDALGGMVVRLDPWMRTSVPGVLGAGDGAGVEGVYVAVAQGQIAAIGAALDLGRISEETAAQRARSARTAIDRKRRLARALTGMYSVGAGVFELADDETVVCRCEGVTMAQVRAVADSTPDIMAIKSLTRAGMGMCQARNCQRHIAETIARRGGTDVSSVALATSRFPIRPVPLGAVADDTVTSEKFFTAVVDE